MEKIPPVTWTGYIPTEWTEWAWTQLALPAQSQQWKHHNNVQNMLKVNNTEPRKTSLLVSLLLALNKFHTFCSCSYCLFWTSKCWLRSNFFLTQTPAQVTWKTHNISHYIGQTHFDFAFFLFVLSWLNYYCLIFPGLLKSLLFTYYYYYHYYYYYYYSIHLFLLDCEKFNPASTNPTKWSHSNNYLQSNWVK